MTSRQEKPQGIFVSYRRTGARADAGRLYDRLAAHFGHHHVFMDIDDIGPGRNFHKVLEETLANCQVLLVIIGPHWLEARDAEGSARLYDEDDFVRIEVLAALQRGLPIIPILINRALMPRRKDLPPGIDGLADYQALEVSDTRFHDDVDELIRTLEQILIEGDQTKAGSRTHRLAVGLMALVVVLVLSWTMLAEWWQRKSPSDSASDPSLLAESQTNNALTLRRQPAQVSQTQMLGMLLETNFFDANHNPAGVGPGTRYELAIIGGDALVIDHSTKLMWQQTGSSRQSPFDEAKAAILGLNEVGFAEYRDWRLPTLEEAISLLKPEKEVGAHISPIFSPRDAPVFWTADGDGAQSVWVVYAYEGTAERESPEFNAWARGIRTMP